MEGNGSYSFYVASNGNTVLDNTVVVGDNPYSTTMGAVRIDGDDNRVSGNTLAAANEELVKNDALMNFLGFFTMWTIMLMSQLDPANQVFLVGTTNHIEDIDPRVLRGGRWSGQTSSRLARHS